jgi:hypothetical protein
VSTDFNLITRRRPEALAFSRLLSEAAGRPVDITGDFTDPNDYLNISADGIWIELEPPGHVEYDDLRAMYPDDVTLPDPDDRGCLWYTFASVPAGAPPFGASVIEQTFQQLARDYDGIALDPR